MQINCLFFNERSAEDEEDGDGEFRGTIHLCRINGGGVECVFYSKTNIIVAIRPLVACILSEECVYFTAEDPPGRFLQATTRDATMSNA